MIDENDIKEHIELLKLNDFYVEELYFIDSPHVGHFRMHPKEYSEKTLEFIKNCLIKSKKND